VIRRLYPEPSGSLDEVELEACYAWPGTCRLRANFIASLDGIIELDGRSGALGTPADHAVFMTLRSLSDVILVGSGTVRAENYGPVALRADRQERRAARNQPSLPALAVVSDSADLDPQAKLFAAPRAEGSPLIVLTTDAAPARQVEGLRSSAEVVVAGDKRVDPVLALEALRERGYGRVLCEGGPGLFGRLLDARLVDELCLSLAPTLAGPGHLSLVGRDPHPPYRLQLHELYEGDGLLLARYASALP
jgi:riboflavin biosynthesis pyrimidine reductase